VNVTLIMSCFSQIVVERLTKNVNEDHLREIFGHYGQIRDLDLPMNRQCKSGASDSFSHVQTQLVAPKAPHSLAPTAEPLV